LRETVSSPVRSEPAAQTRFEDTAATASKTGKLPTPGAETTVHFDPSQCSVSGRLSFPSPTIQTSLLALPLTERKSPCAPGVWTRLQLVPSQCSAIGPLLLEATAQTSSAAIASTAMRSASDVAPGTSFHAIPSQCSISASLR